MTFDRKTFVDLIKSLDTPIFVKLTATWCKPCQQIAPFVKEWFNKLTENNIPYIVILLNHFLIIEASKKIIKVYNYE